MTLFSWIAVILAALFALLIAFPVKKEESPSGETPEQQRKGLLWAGPILIGFFLLLHFGWLWLAGVVSGISNQPREPSEGEAVVNCLCRRFPADFAPDLGLQGWPVFAFRICYLPDLAIRAASTSSFAF